MHLKKLLNDRKAGCFDNMPRQMFDWFRNSSQGKNVVINVGGHDAECSDFTRRIENFYAFRMHAQIEMSKEVETEIRLQKISNEKLPIVLFL